MSAQNPPRQYCSQISAQAGENLPGTASRTQVYLLLEYNGAWGEKAFEESGLPSPVKHHLAAHAKAIEGARILLIRGDPGMTRGVHFYVALVSEASQALYQFLLPDYESLLDLEITRLAGEPSVFRDYLRLDPLFLVCTNGRRDACCSRFGLPVYQALRQSLGEQVWQCSHLGGHRFAANLLCLPAGVLYGRVAVESAELVAKASLDGQVEPGHYRGRVCYPPAAQAAEYLLRKQTGQKGIDSFHLFSVEETQPGRWRARFLERSTRQTHQLILQAEVLETQIFESCRMDKLAHGVNYRLVDFKTFESSLGVA